MAAPDGTTWGSTVNSYGRIGIYVDKIASTDTQLQYQVQVWFWSKYSVSDSSNTFKYNHLTSSGSATTSRGSRSISTTSDSGGWSTTNQKKIYTTSTYTISRTTSSQKRYIYASLSGVERVGGTMKASKTYTIAARTKYTITYNANGGSSAPAATSGYAGLSTTITEDEPEREDYVFIGWATSSSATSATYSPGGSITLTSNITLYAVWQKDVDTIKYNLNGGSGDFATQTKTSGASITLHTGSPTRTYYSFNNWNTAKDGTGTTYKPGATYSGGSVTLYAQWTPYTHTVAYDANGGTGAPSSQTKTAGTTLKLSTTVPTYDEHHFFKGWTTDTNEENEDRIIYQSGGSYTSDQNGGTVTLYALWVTDDIIFSSSGDCEAINFVEGTGIKFKTGGILQYPELVEKVFEDDENPTFSSTQITFSQFIEK